jgi:peptide/nickel transport system ATP-binding protein
MTAPLLQITDMSVTYATPQGSVRAVDGVSLTVEKGESVGIVGESGSGKSTVAHAVLKLLPRSATQQGRVVLQGADLTAMNDRELGRIRGDKAGMVFQDPMTSFDPQRTIGYHLRAGLQAHNPEMTRAERQRIVVEQLRRTGLPEPEYQANRYPHELSGGMRQRSMLALALENSPALLLADEPTTALDVTIQAQILRLFTDLLEDEALGAAMILISHDLAVVRQVCSRIVVMYAGRIVEDAPTEELFAEPRHPYTQALIRATPRAKAGGGRLSTIPGRPPALTGTQTACSFRDRCSHAFDRCFAENPSLERTAGGRWVACFLGVGASLPPLAEHTSQAEAGESFHGPVGEDAMVVVDNVTMRFHTQGSGSWAFRKQELHALRGVSVRVSRGETLGIVGESGSGKSTLARIVLGLQAPTSGTVLVAGEDPRKRRSSARTEQRLQAVFQDPHGSLNPRMSVQEAVGEPLKNLGMSSRNRQSRVAELLDEVQLGRHYASRYPSELSGGQAQRVAIARALAAEPDVVVLDEPTSGLDISIQAHILNLLGDLQASHHLTYLLISHDLTIVQHLADRIAVMHLGQIVELAETDETFRAPAHPYTAGLLAAVPEIDRPGKPQPLVVGEPPSPLDPPPGCSFHTRCPIAKDVCREVDPPLDPHRGGLVACHFPGEIAVVATVTETQTGAT